MIKNCIICNNEFKQISGRQLCCSKECSKIKWKEYQKIPKRVEYQKEYQKIPKRVEYQKEYQVEYRYDHKEKSKNYQREYLKTIRGMKAHQSAGRKYTAKRQRNLGWNPLNNWFEGSEGHHINKIDVIYIPKDYHFRGHSVLQNKNMEPINTVAFFFLVMQNIEEIRKVI